MVVKILSKRIRKAIKEGKFEVLTVKQVEEEVLVKPRKEK